MINIIKDSYLKKYNDFNELKNELIKAKDSGNYPDYLDSLYEILESKNLINAKLEFYKKKFNLEKFSITRILKNIKDF